MVGWGGQGGDLSAGTQALPVGKIIEVEVFRKDNQSYSRFSENFKEIQF